MPISHKHQPLVYPDYINPLPADDIIRIGAVKQDLYDKNYDKIQSHINELDKYGLEILRPNDRKYFTQEMDKYMNVVNDASAKTDFGNMANLRSVLSISRPLENDPLILNSIKSSEEVRRRQKVLSSLKPEERNPSNEWVYMKDVYDWQSNPEVGATLSQGKEYTPFADPSEYLNDILPKVKADIRTEIVRDGRYNETREIEEVTNTKLKQWMDANLPQRYKDQIMMDAMYTVKDVSPEEMANHYFDSRKNQYDQIKRTMGMYEARGKYLNPEQVNEYKSLSMQAAILEDNLSNPPKTAEAAYTAWINDHYNASLTGQADFYAHRQEKKKLESDPFSLASYNSSLRQNEAYYRDITLEQEQKRLGLGKYSDEGEEGTGGGKMTKAEKKNAEQVGRDAREAFKKFTNGFSKSSSWEKIDPNRLTSEESELLQNTLKQSMYLYKDQAKTKEDKDKWAGTIPSEIDLDQVQVRYDTKDKSYHFRVNTKIDAPGIGTGNVIHEILQDKFDDAFNEASGLNDANALIPESLGARVIKAENPSVEDLKKLAEDRIKNQLKNLGNP